MNYRLYLDFQLFLMKRWRVSGEGFLQSSAFSHLSYFDARDHRTDNLKIFALKIRKMYIFM